MSTTAIVGLGVMGASFARRLKEKGRTILGYDTDPVVIDYALDHGWIDEGSTVFDDALKTADEVIVCIYPAKLKGVLKNMAPWLSKGCRVMEISGVKSMIMNELPALLPEGVELVSIHPMCGREARGPAFSDPKIFDKANFLIIPHETATPEGESVITTSDAAIEAARALGKELGCQSISMLSAAEHDEMIAFLSQLTHVIAVSLMNVRDCSHLVKYTGDSFRDLTRIARINEDMWSELFLLNKPALLSEIEAFRDSLDRFTKALENNDTESMKEMFITSTERRQKFEQ